jgi:HAD superfamily hydrolase (TIGR01509 family)
MAYRGLIFDFNGVLWWDGHLQVDAWRAFSVRLRGFPLSEDELNIHVHGRPNAYTIEYLAGRPLTRAELEGLSEEKERSYRALCLQQGKAFALSPGAIPLLSTLVAASIPRTIATASGSANVDFFFRHLNLSQWFDRALVVLDNGQRAGKPAPDVYLEAATQIGLTPQECIVVEDSVSGIQAANAAGIGWVVALCPEEWRERLKQWVAADQVIESLADLDTGRLLG